jgi:hypothetical protein
MDTVTLISTASTLHPSWIRQHMPVFGDELTVVLASERFANAEASLRAQAPTTLSVASGSAWIIFFAREHRALRARLSPIQAERFVDMIARVLVHNVNTRAALPNRKEQP